MYASEVVASTNVFMISFYSDTSAVKANESFFILDAVRYLAEPDPSDFCISDYRSVDIRARVVPRASVNSIRSATVVLDCLSSEKTLVPGAPAGSAAELKLNYYASLACTKQWTRNMEIFRANPTQRRLCAIEKATNCIQSNAQKNYVGFLLY